MPRDVERDLREVVGEFPRPDERSVRELETRVVAAPRPRGRRPWRGKTFRAVTVATALGAAFLVGASSNATGRDAFGEASGDPTLTARRYEIGGTTRVDLAGRIPNERAGEYVEILERECGTEHFRIASGASTEQGGFWTKNELFFFTTVTYVARWNGRLSDEVTLRSPLYVLPFPLKNRRWRIMVNTRLQSMVGKTVVLQRKTQGDTWVRVRTARLRHGGSFGTFQAVVRIPTRGLTMRVLVPQASARPCHDAVVSPSWPT
jgi:hypothetical protein